MSGTVPPRLEPPADATPVDAASGQHNPAWAGFFQDVADQLAALNGSVVVLRGDVQQLAARQMLAASVATSNPPGTGSPTIVMMGLGLSYTPQVSTRAFFTVDGQIGNNTNNGQSVARLYYGPGVAPVNGVVPPLTSFPVGEPVRFTAAAAGDYTPFSAAALLTGLTLGQAYWVDVGLQAPSGFATITDVELTGFGLLDPLTLT